MFTQFSILLDLYAPLTGREKITENETLTCSYVGIEVLTKISVKWFKVARLADGITTP